VNDNHVSDFPFPIVKKTEVIREHKKYAGWASAVVGYSVVSGLPLSSKPRVASRDFTAAFDDAGTCANEMSP
jgi:hypothetical protein